MESHIFLGCWNCFFCGKGPWEFDLAVRSTPCACCAEPGSSSASAAPLRRCCWRRCWGLCLGAAASGWEVDGRNLQSQKPWELAANALWKCERIVEAPFFLKLSCSTSGGVLSLKMNGTHLHEGFENDIPLQMGEIWNISFQPFIFWGCALPETSTCKLDGWEDEKYVRFWGLNAYFQGRNCC